MPKEPSDAACRAALADRLDALLPQTQCRRCGYDDCRGYAEALAAGAADIDRCPPGGAEGVARLASATGRPVRPLDPACGEEAPRAAARIDEEACIGCTLCIAACPVDAIVGAPKTMHTVVRTQCTGCALCLPACPVDCIALPVVGTGRTGWAAWSGAEADAARARYRRHRHRQAQRAAPAVDASDASAPRAASSAPAGCPASTPDADPAGCAGDPALVGKSASSAASETPAPPSSARRAAVEAALARARARAATRAHGGPGGA